MDVTIETVEWGFVAARAGDSKGGDWVWVFADGLETDGGQYCRMAAREVDSGARHELVVLTQKPESDRDHAIVNEALLREYPDAVSIALTADRWGYAEAAPSGDAPAAVVAAAIAASKASGGWEFSDPFEILVGGERYLVRTTYDGECWRAVAARR